MNAPAYKRQQWLVEPTYQWRVTRLLLVALLAIVIVTLLLIYYAMWSTLGDLEIWPTRLTASLFKAVSWMVIVELTLIVPLVVIAGIVLTHRVVGPVARIKNALDQIGQGNYNVRLKLRDHDVLTEVADAVNRLAVKLRESSK